MASHSHNDDELLQALKHDAVPGYLRAFLIAFSVMTIYLTVILVSSPGPAKGHHHDDHEKGGHKVENGHNDDSH